MIALEMVLLMVVVGLVIIGFARRNSRYKNYPPGPFPWPFIGNMKELHELSKKMGGQHEALLELSRRYESPIICLRLGKSNTIVVSGSESINSVLCTEEYDGRPWNYFIQLRNMGKKKGLTMNDGQGWRDIKYWFVKSMKSIGFARREMTDFIKDELLTVINEIQDGGVRTIKPIIVPAIMNVIWIFATGKRFNNDKLQYFIKLMERRAQAFDMTGGVLSAYPWLRHIAPGYSGYNLLVTINNEFKSILMETIDEHKKNHIPESKADLIDMFLSEMYTGKGPKAGFDEDQLVIILVDILIAGLNITATTLDFLFLNMLINQDSQHLLHEEIDRVIGQEKLPDSNDMSKMLYTQAVILESQRLVPVVPIIGPRRVLRDTKLFDYDIPKDSFVLMNLHSIHADPKLYPEPYTFKPERFLKDGALVRDANLLFFGKGKRQCPGVSLARTSLFLLFTGIMQRYELVPVPDEKPPKMEFKMSLTMQPKPYRVLLVPRTQPNIHH